MKILFYLCLILFYIKSINGGCTQYQCLNSGDGCTRKGTYCPPGTYCEITFDNPLCAESKKILDSCSYQSQCDSGLICFNEGDDQYCANIKYKGQGESCKKDIECSDSMTCTNKTCTYSGTSCKTYSCKAGQFCNSQKTCQSFFSDGTQCTKDLECKPNSRCIITSNAKVSQCTPMNSLGAGLPCNSADSCDIGLNLVCFQGYCTEYKSALDSNSTCSDNTQCISDKAQCICDSVKAPTGPGTCQEVYSIGSTCKKDKLNYFDCIAQSNCPLQVTNKNSNETCLAIKCGDLKCKYEVSCINSDYQCGKAPVCSDSSFLKHSSLFYLLSLIISIVILI
ncbi:hypothetical protein ACTFIU_011101 [Dictyostelium citrinum]